MSSFTFNQLAMEGQKRLRNGDRKGAVPLYVAAIKKGTEDNKMLSAVHSQLGNCLISLGMYEMAIQNHQRDLDLTLHQLEDAPGAAMSWANLGSAYKSKGDYQSACRCFQQMLGLGGQLKNGDLQAKALIYLAHTYEAAGHDMIGKNEQASAELLSKARDTFLMQLRLSERDKDLGGIGRACGYLGNLYDQIDNPGRAVPYYKRRLRLAQEVGDLAAQGRAYCNLGNVYRKLKKLDKASRCYLQDIRICVELKDQPGEAITCGNLASAYQAKGDGEATLQYLTRQSTLLNKLSDHTARRHCLKRTGDVQLAVGKYKEAVQTFKELLKVAKVVGNVEFTQAAIAKLDEAKAKVKDGKLISHSDAVAALSSTLDNDESSRTIPKWTVRGTMSRMFGKRFRDKHAGELAMKSLRGSPLDDGSFGPGIEQNMTTEFPAGDGDDQSAAGSLRISSKRKSTMMRRLSTMFTKGDQEDGIYLPSPDDKGSNADFSDDSCDEDDFGLDELVFALAEIEKEATARQKEDMANVGSDKRRDGSARKAAAVLGNPILSASLPPQAEAADAGPAASSEVQPLESTWDKEDGYIEMMGAEAGMEPGGVPGTVRSPRIQAQAGGKQERDQMQADVSRRGTSLLSALDNLEGQWSGNISTDAADV